MQASDFDRRRGPKTEGRDRVCYLDDNTVPIGFINTELFTDLVVELFTLDGAEPHILLRRVCDHLSSLYNA